MSGPVGMGPAGIAPLATGSAPLAAPRAVDSVRSYASVRSVAWQAARLAALRGATRGRVRAILARLRAAGPAVERDARRCGRRRGAAAVFAGALSA